MAEKEHKLSQEHIDHFLEHGWLKLSGCFTREQSAEIQSHLWIRLGMDPNDISTWDTKSENGRVNMPIQKYFPASTIAPKAWSGICELLGGEHRVNDSVSNWKDSFIVNLGTPQGAGKYIKPQDLRGWHVDGDFFVHYLDSPEQALLVVPLWSDIVPNGGGTVICPAAIPIIAKHLYDNPEGVSPRMTPRAKNPTFASEGSDLSFFNNIAKQMPDEAFIEVTGEVGDVYLLHPLMLHSSSNNTLRKVRIITNPPVSVKEPFCFNRADGQYSIVEQKTLKALEKERLEGWKMAAERQRLVSDGAKMKAELKRLEDERLAKLNDIDIKTVEVDSIA